MTCAVQKRSKSNNVQTHMLISCCSPFGADLEAPKTNIKCGNFSLDFEGAVGGSKKMLTPSEHEKLAVLQRNATLSHVIS